MNFDQTNEYDFAGRLKKNNVGASGSTFNQKMGYDAFNNLTSRENLTYQTYPSEFSATYTNNRKSSGGSTDTYDTAGNVVYSTSPAVQGGQPYTDIKNWNFDAAGRLAHWDENGPWGANTKHEDLTYDGDGRAVKKIDSQNVPWHYIFSTVTGQKITDVVVGGSDGGYRVYMGSTLIYDDNTAVAPDVSAIGFKVTDPISGSTQELLTSGAIPDPEDAPAARNEMAGLGTSVPTIDPDSYPEPEIGGGSPGDAEGGCRIDGFSFGTQHCNNNAAWSAQCPNNNCGPKRAKDARTGKEYWTFPFSVEGNKGGYRLGLWSQVIIKGENGEPDIVGKPGLVGTTFIETGGERSPCNMSIGLTNRNNLLNERQLSIFKQEISRIYGGIGVKTNFIGPNTGDYSLRIEPVGSAFSQAKPKTVGFTPLHEGGQSVNNGGWIFEDRLIAGATQSWVSDFVFQRTDPEENLATGLARAGAHEIGHWALQQTDDAPHYPGPMKDKWGGVEWFGRHEEMMNRWSFTPDQGRAIRNFLCPPPPPRPRSRFKGSEPEL